jgi:Flp pilus assembly pilin Flp
MAQLLYLTWRGSWQTVARLRADARGAVGVEYGLLAALVAIAILGSLRGLGLSLTNLPLPSLVAAFQGALQ